MLQGCSLVFSRVMPLEQDPRTHALWRMAEQYGATCSTHCSDATTHVVAAARGTEKVGWCSLVRLYCGKHSACAPWLWHAATEMLMADSVLLGRCLCPYLQTFWAMQHSRFIVSTAWYVSEPCPCVSPSACPRL